MAMWRNCVACGRARSIWNMRSASNRSNPLQKPPIDQFLRPLEEGLTDLLQGTTNAEGAAKLRNGNPAICFTTAEYGDEIWVSYEGKAQAIGRYKSGEIHPTRVILQD